MGNMKVHWHVVPVRSWATSTLSTSCCCLHGGHRLLGVIPMPGSSPTLLLAPTSRPVLTEQPSCSLPSAAAGHPPISRAAIVAWRTEGWPVEEAAAGGLPATGFGSTLAACRRRVRCIVCPRYCCRSWDGKWASDVLPNPSLPPCCLETLAGPLTEAIKAVKAFARPLVQPQIATPGRLVTVRDRGSGVLSVHN